MELKKQFEFIIKKELSHKFSAQKIERAAMNMSYELIDIMQERTGEGIDIKGKRLRKLSRGYKKFKYKYIKSGNRYKPKKRGKRRRASTTAHYRDLNETTEHKAKNIPNYGRLTGKLFSSYNPIKPKVSQISGGIKISWGVKIKGKRNIKIYSYLEKMGRRIFGITDIKKPRGQKELNRLRDVFLDTLRIKIKIGKVV